MGDFKITNKIDFFLVGAARCGTTSLYNYLNVNEEIFLPKVKEPNFFSNVDSPNLEDFVPPKPNIDYHTKIITSRKVYDSLYEKASDKQLKGDTSPSYLWDKSTASKIFNHNPEAKIIISLRHPVDRAYSHYNMNYFTGVERNKTFVEALNAPKNLIWGSCNQYLEMSAYYEQVKIYYDIFPKEQIKILVYEDWTKNIDKEIKELLDFLNIDPAKQIIDNKIEYNKIKQVNNIKFLNLLRKSLIKRTIKKILSKKYIDKIKSYLFENNNDIEKLNPKTRNNLSLKFKEDIEKLSNLTGINFAKKWK